MHPSKPIRVFLSSTYFVTKDDAEVKKKSWEFEWEIKICAHLRFIRPCHWIFTRRLKNGDKPTTCYWTTTNLRHCRRAVPALCLVHDQDKREAGCCHRCHQEEQMPLHLSLFWLFFIYWELNVSIALVCFHYNWFTLFDLTPGLFVIPTQSDGISSLSRLKSSTSTSL